MDLLFALLFMSRLSSSVSLLLEDADTEEEDEEEVVAEVRAMASSKEHAADVALTSEWSGCDAGRM